MQLPPLPSLAAAARTWAVESQQVSRRNAMLAATECSQRRVEREDVADYLAARTPPAPGSADTAGRAAQR
jgi:hypothetical protein